LTFDVFEAISAADARAIVDACDAIYLGPNGLACAKGFSDKRFVYFTPDYQHARGYALNQGGERLAGALSAGTFFCDFVVDQERVRSLANHWREILNEHGPHGPTQRVLDNLRDEQLLQRLHQEVRSAVDRLRSIVRFGHSIVYAVEVDAEQRNPGALLPNSEIRLNYLPPERLLGKARFLNGIAPESE
jgi:hypothetical protein